MSITVASGAQPHFGISFVFVGLAWPDWDEAMGWLTAYHSTDAVGRGRRTHISFRVIMQMWISYAWAGNSGLTRFDALLMMNARDDGKRYCLFPFLTLLFSSLLSHQDGGYRENRKHYCLLFSTPLYTHTQLTEDDQTHQLPIYLFISDIEGMPRAVLHSI